MTTETTIDQTDECKRALDDDGYVIFRGVVSRESLDELHAALDAEYARLAAAGKLTVGGGSFSGHLNCFPGEAARSIYEQLVGAGIPELVRSIRPDLADRPRLTLNYNLPGSVAQHYHMDGVYTEDFLICNVAVVDTDLVNGALDVLPATNQQFYPFWKYALQRKRRLTKRVPLQQGDVVLRRSTLWHRGMPNRSAAARPMLAVTYGETTEANADVFGPNDGGIIFYPNWFRPTRLGRLRERVFVTAPISYSAYRFARSLYGKKGYSS